MLSYSLKVSRRTTITPALSGVAAPGVMVTAAPPEPEATAPEPPLEELTGPLDPLPELVPPEVPPEAEAEPPGEPVEDTLPEQAAIRPAERRAINSDAGF
jgi:hypothetical protein